MDPERRKMLKVELMDVAATDTMFDILMGDEVRRAANSSRTTP